MLTQASTLPRASKGFWELKPLSKIRLNWVTKPTPDQRTSTSVSAEEPHTGSWAHCTQDTYGQIPSSPSAEHAAWRPRAKPPTQAVEHPARPLVPSENLVGTYAVSHLYPWVPREARVYCWLSQGHQLSRCDLFVSPSSALWDFPCMICQVSICFPLFNSDLLGRPPACVQHMLLEEYLLCSLSAEAVPSHLFFSKNFPHYSCMFIHKNYMSIRTLRAWVALEKFFWWFTVTPSIL